MMLFSLPFPPGQFAFSDHLCNRDFVQRLTGSTRQAEQHQPSISRLSASFSNFTP